jgi:hypothetical protein
VNGPRNLLQICCLLDDFAAIIKWARWQKNSASKDYNGRRDNQDLRLPLSVRRAVSRSCRAARRSLAELEFTLPITTTKNRPKIEEAIDHRQRGGKVLLDFDSAK